MNKNKYSYILSGLFVLISLISYIYLSYLFTSTDFLKANEVNSLIPIIITFFLGVGLKSIYTFFMSSTTLYDTRYERHHKFTTNVIDFATALTFYIYIIFVVGSKYLLPLFALVGAAIVIALVLLIIKSISDFKQTYREWEEINKKEGDEDDEKEKA